MSMLNNIPRSRIPAQSCRLGCLFRVFLNCAEQQAALSIPHCPELRRAAGCAVYSALSWTAQSCKLRCLFCVVLNCAELQAALYIPRCPELRRAAGCAVYSALSWTAQSCRLRCLFRVVLNLIVFILALGLRLRLKINWRKNLTKSKTQRVVLMTKVSLESV